MNSNTWASVDRYFEESLIPRDAALDGALDRSTANGLPKIQVAPNQGKMLMLLAKVRGARAILEVGTLGGYSTIWLAKALPEDGRLVTLEFDPKHAEVARANVHAAGFGARVDIKVGAALETLPTLRGQTFDFVFIDADKVNTPDYFEAALGLTEPGSVIVVDNVVREARIVDEGTSDEDILGVREFFSRFGDDPRVEMTAVQTVGAKGYDGFALARVR